MSPPLTIRNLSSTPLELKVIERYTGVGGGSSAVQSVSRFATNLTSTVGFNVSGPSNARIAENAQSFAHEETNIRLDPFQMVNTEKGITERDAKDILRLTFEAEGQRYRADVPAPQNHSNTLTPLVNDPRFRFTAVYVPGDAFLAIYSSANLDSWMGEMDDRTPISALSIPGTHNSPTCHKALPSVRCQAVSPRAQLDNGVRFFDIRVQPENPTDPSRDGLILVHGVFPISMTGNKYFRGLVDEVRSFLDAHPSETVILSIKREGPGQHTDSQLGNILRDHYAGDVHQWWTEPRIPRLGETRGKIVLLRRFGLDDRLRGEWDGRGWAVNAENWAYNTPNDEHGDVIVQDFCEVLDTENIDRKIQVTTEALDRSGGDEFDINDEGSVPKIHLNFLSASNFWKVGCWPEKIAAKLNPAVVQHLVVRHVVEKPGADWSTGIVICDWVGNEGDWDLVRCIVGMNAKLMVKQRG